MVNAPRIFFVRTAASILLRLFGCLFVLFGLLGSVFRWVFPSRLPHTHLEMFLSVLIFFSAAMIGVAVVFRFRVAAIVLSVWFGYLGADEVYGMLHDFSLPEPPHISLGLTVSMAVFAVVPALLTVVAWKKLR